MKSPNPNRLALSLWCRDHVWGPVRVFFRGVPSTLRLFLEMLLFMGCIAVFLSLFFFLGVLNGCAVTHWLFGSDFWVDPDNPAMVTRILSALNRSMEVHPGFWATVTALSGLGGAGRLGWWWRVKAGKNIQNIPPLVLLPGLLVAASGFGWVALAAVVAVSLLVAFGILRALVCLGQWLFSLPSRLREKRDAILQANPEALAAFEKVRLESVTAASSPLSSNRKSHL
jgi:hypothetical protein